MQALSGVDAARIVAFHDQAGDGARDAPVAGEAAWAAIAANHACNRRLWHEEDLVRRPNAPPAELVANKRAIDRLNQERNDAVERLDEALLASLAARIDPAARLHSETPGMIVDRLSILALRLRAMRAQADRADAGPAHRESCRAKVSRLEEQRADLAQCLDALLADCAQGRARFKVYRQFKMYNDPALNPHLKA